MKTTTIHALLALLTGAIATAQPPQGGEGPPPRAPMPLINALDADHDKAISAAEIAASSAALATLDANGDGQITPDELRPQPPEGAPEGGRPQGGRPEGDRPEGAPGQPPSGKRPMNAPPVVAALDSDKDHVFSAAEIAAAPAALATLDKNADGQLTPDEFAPGPPRRKGPPQQSGNR